MDFAQANIAHASVMAEMDKICFDEGCFDEPLFSALLMQEGCVGLMAMKEGRPVGQILFRYLKFEAEILTISVLPEYRGQGIARKMVNETFSFLKEKKVQDIYLEVRKSNEAAVSLYNFFGGKVVGERPGYYENVDGSREDAYVFQLSLN